MRKHFEFEGEPDGDGECFCWNVDRETFVKIVGREPTKWDTLFTYDTDEVSGYRLYPSDLTGTDQCENDSPQKFRFTFTMEDCR